MRTDVKRGRFSSSINKSLHAPTAFHTIERSFREAIYLACYRSFTYDNIYVASFPSEKEKFTATDQARIGSWFNALAVVHELGNSGTKIGKDVSLYELGLRDSGVELELTRNSPWTEVFRTVGPLAFSAMALYAGAVEAKPLSEIKSAKITAKVVGKATDKCDVVVPPDLELVAKGYGLGRWEQHCRLATTVESGAAIKPTARFKSPRRAAVTKQTARLKLPRKKPK